jgi:hypothetical protein
MTVTTDYVAEASELGLKPGQWPIYFEHDFGCGVQVWSRAQVIRGHGGVLYAIYRSGDELLQIVND